MEARLAVLGVDGQRNKAGKSFRDAGVEFKVDSRGEVPVWLEAGDPADRHMGSIIGSAKLSIHEKVVWADTRLLDDKLPGSLVKILYPHVCGAIKRVVNNHVEEMVIDGINLSADEPLDGRIATLANQGVKARKKG